MTNYPIKQDFKTWCCDYSGIHGGNPKGDLWVCGIEYGGKDPTPRNFDKDHEHFNQEGIPCWDPKGQENYPTYNPDCTSWSFIQKIAKIALTMEGKEISLEAAKNYIKTRLCRRENGNTFLLNLYPLPFQNSQDNEWTKDHLIATGLPHKIMYKAFCMENRFPILKKLVTQYTPKVLICVGTTFSDDYKTAFLPKEDRFQKGLKHTLPSGKTYETFKINKGKTTLLITPFLGQGGIMSDTDLSFIGQQHQIKHNKP